MAAEMFVSKIEAYPTPSKDTKYLVSIGMTVASRLNGTGDWLGSFVKRDYDGRYIGNVVYPKHFGRKPVDLNGDPVAVSLDDPIFAAAFAEANAVIPGLEKKYPRALKMDSKHWKWGDEITGDGIPEGARQVLFVEDGVVYAQDVAEQTAAARTVTPKTATAPAQ